MREQNITTTGSKNPHTEQGTESRLAAVIVAVCLIILVFCAVN
jgi:hypothetical protein